MSAPFSFLSVRDRSGDNSDQFSAALYQFGHALRVSMVGIVQSFDVAKQTVTVQLVTSEKINVPTSGVPVATDTPLPLLVDVPIVLPRGGNFLLTMPIQTGDECLVIFTDMDFDAWFQSGGVNNSQIAGDRHDLWNCVAVVGLWSQPKVVASYSTTNAELRSLDGTVKITLSAAGGGDITITAPGQLTINSPNVVIDGDVLIDGTCKIDGIDFGSHIHSGVTTGGSDTGVPVP